MPMEAEDYQILCVEDNTDNQVLLKYYLKNEPYNLTFANDGLIALKLLEKELFDLFLVDMNLPNGMNGYDVAREIRQDDRHKTKPVIIITAFSKLDIDEPEPALHINKFISKPIRKDEFIDMLNSYFSN